MKIKLPSKKTSKRVVVSLLFVALVIGNGLLSRQLYNLIKVHEELS